MRPDTQKQHEKALTIADLCKAIERRDIPSMRQGDEYVLRQADVRRLRARRTPRHDTLPEILRSRETLKVGRPA